MQVVVKFKAISLDILSPLRAIPISPMVLLPITPAMHWLREDFWKVQTILHPAGNTDSARLRKRLQTCRYVNAITPKITAFNDEFAEVDAYPELETLVLRHVRIAFGHAALN